MIAVRIIGALIARFRAKGMTLTLFVMAIAQALIVVIALFTDMAEAPGSSVIEIIGVNGFFIMLFIVAALLFRYAGRETPSL